MQSAYIRTGYTEVREQQVDQAELVVEDADNSDNLSESEVVAFVIQDFESGDRLAVVQLTEDKARELYAALGAVLTDHALSSQRDGGL